MLGFQDSPACPSGKRRIKIRRERSIGGMKGVICQCHLVYQKTHKARTVTHKEGPPFEAGEQMSDPWQGQLYVVKRRVPVSWQDSLKKKHEVYQYLRWSQLLKLCERTVVYINTNNQLDATMTVY